MNSIKEKLKLIFLPFLVIAICFVLLYTFLHWLLFIRFEVFSLKEDIIKLWAAFILPWIPVLIWLRPRLKTLQFKNDNGSFGLQLLAAMAIAAPTIVAQDYIITATGKITEIEQIAQYEQKEKTKYYSLNNYFIDKSNAGVIYTATVSGKYNKDLNLLIYIALPVFNHSSDTVKGETSYFIGKKYAHTISNRLSEAEKDDKFKEFANESQVAFDTTNFNEFVYLEKLGHSDDNNEFKRAAGKVRNIADREPIVFTAHMDAFEARTGGTFGWIFKAFGIGALVFFIVLLFPKFDETSLANFKQGIKRSDNDYKEMFDLLIPKHGYFATPLIMNLNVLIYVIMVVAGLGFITFQASDLLNWGGNYRPYVMNGEWWRLLTSIFLHGGPLHLLANMLGLVFVGIFLEPLLGSKKYATIYLATGVIASCASIWWHPATVSVGASGAVFGLYGLFLAFMLLKVFPGEFNKAFLLSTLVFVGYNLLMGLTGGIDNAAHIGGLLSGFVIGLFLSPSLKTAVVEQAEE